MPLCFGGVGVGAGEGEDVVQRGARRTSRSSDRSAPTGRRRARRAGRCCRGRIRHWVRCSPGTTYRRRRGSAGGNAPSARRCRAGAVCCRASGSRTRRWGRRWGHPLRELLGDDHLLERRQSAAAILDRPARREVPGLVQRLAPIGHEPGDLVTNEPTQTVPFGRELLGEKRLHLLAVLLGFSGVRRLHGRSLDDPGYRSGRGRRLPVRRAGDGSGCDEWPAGAGQERDHGEPAEM